LSKQLRGIAAAVLFPGCSAQYTTTTTLLGVAGVD